MWLCSCQIQERDIYQRSYSNNYKQERWIVLELDDEVWMNAIVEKMVENFQEHELFVCATTQGLPNKKEVIEIIRDLRKILFPGYFSSDIGKNTTLNSRIENGVIDLFSRLKKQIEISLCCKNKCNANQENLTNIERKNAEEITKDLFSQLPYIQKKLLLDVEAAFEGDPSAQSKEEVIFSFPGVFAIYVYRIAHVLYQHKVPFIPRILTEYAHSRTGIDIHAGAVIGDYFFIDHGTGVVIGETTVIGNRVKLYQGVTLGALSTRSGQSLAGKQRHPKIEDGVTIYASSTILGGETVIGKDSVIAGNTFIIESVPPNTKVSIKVPELIFKGYEGIK